MNQDEYLLIWATFQTLVDGTRGFTPAELVPEDPRWPEMYRHIAQVFKENR
jgi:hypothetical protein